MLLLGLKFSTGWQIAETQRQPGLGKSSRPGEGSSEHVMLGTRARGGEEQDAAYWDNVSDPATCPEVLEDRNRSRSGLGSEEGQAEADGI